MNEKRNIRNRDKHRNQIIEAMKVLIEEKGYANISIREITEASKLSTGLIYQNFPKGKSDIVLEIIRNEFQDNINPTEFMMAPVSDFKRIFRNTLDNLVKSHRKNQKLIEAFEVAILSTPELDLQIENFSNEMTAFMPQLLKNLLKQGIIDIDDPDKWGKWIASIIDSMIHGHILFNSFNVNDSQFTDILYQTIQRLLKLKI